LKRQCGFACASTRRSSVGELERGAIVIALADACWRFAPAVEFFCGS